MKDICVNCIDPYLFFKFLGGTLPRQLILGKIIEMTSIQHAGTAFQNGFEYRNFDLQVLNGNIFCYICAIMMKTGPVA